MDAKVLSERIGTMLESRLPNADIYEKKLYGGNTFMVRGNVCVTVGGREGVSLMVRIGKDAHHQALTHQGATTTRLYGKTYRGYVDLDERALGELDYWLDLAVAHNLTLADKSR